MICSSVKRDFLILPPPGRGGLYLKLEGFKGLRSATIDFLCNIKDVIMHDNPVSRMLVKWQYGLRVKTLPRSASYIARNYGSG